MTDAAHRGLEMLEQIGAWASASHVSVHEFMELLRLIRARDQAVLEEAIQRVLALGRKRTDPISYERAGAMEEIRAFARELAEDDK